MRRTIPTIALSIAGLAVFAAPAAASTTPPDSPDTTFVDEPAATEAPTDTTATAEIGAADGSAVVVVDESGSELAALTVSNAEQAWTGYGENNDPASGHEYLRVTVVVESRSPRGLFAVEYDDFILQDADGFVTRAEIVPTAEESAAEEDPVSEADLANAETVELVITFEIVSGVAPIAVFYAPSNERLVTVHEFD